MEVATPEDAMRCVLGESASDAARHYLLALSRKRKSVEAPEEQTAAMLLLPVAPEVGFRMGPKRAPGHKRGRDDLAECAQVQT